MGDNTYQQNSPGDENLGILGHIKKTDPERYERLKNDPIHIFIHRPGSYSREGTRSSYIMCGESFHSCGDSKLEMNKLELALAAHAGRLRKEGFSVWVHHNRRIHSVRRVYNR
jgi:hypothetical protein